MDVEEDRFTIPRLSEEVFRRVKLTNTSDLVIWKRAALYADEAYVGTIAFPLSSGGEYQLNFGTDERVEGRERLSADASGNSAGKRKDLGYQITISNPTEETLSVVVQDQIPVSQHEEIKVSLDKAEPTPDKKDDLNRMTWKLSLPPKTKKLIQFQFVIEAPADMEIRGLPRDGKSR